MGLRWRTASQRMQCVVQLVSREKSVSGKTLAEGSRYHSPWEGWRSHPSHSPPSHSPPSHSHLVAVTMTNAIWPTMAILEAAKEEKEKKIAFMALDGGVGSFWVV